MATQWANAEYVDGDLDVASPIGIPVFQAPIPSTTKPYVFTQDYMQLLEFFEETPLNTPHDSAGLDPDYSSYFLVAESPRQDVRGGLVKWTRTYAIVPDTHVEPESYGYQFIGYAGVWVVGGAPAASVTGRPRKLHVVTSRVVHEYFKTGPGAPYARGEDIPTLQAQQYLALSPTSEQLDTEYLQDNVTIAGFTFTATIPSKTEYKTWVSNATANGWSSATSGTAKGQLLAETSRLSRWRGNIFLRTTRYILAQ